jgi:isopentenyl phosphate kinase
MSSDSNTRKKRTKILVIKFGGSVITNKNKPYSFRENVVLRLINELKEFMNKSLNKKIILIHGGGSFGHAKVKECLEGHGYIDKKCYTETAHVMMILNSLIMRAIIDAGIDAISIPTRSIFIKSGNELSMYSCIIDAHLRRGVIPVLFGDVIIDRKSGYQVLSGDTIAWYVSKVFNADEIYFVTDVDGLFDKDPKIFKNAKLIKEIRSKELMDLHYGKSEDVTGGMLNKVMGGLDIGVKDVKVIVLNGLIKGNLYNALMNEPFVGTVIWY